MVGPDRPNQGHDHQGGQIRDTGVQSGTTFTGVAESKPAANQPTATATAVVPARDAAATLHKAGADSVPPAYLPAGQANSTGPNPSARCDPAKPSYASADAERSAPRRLRRITIVPHRRRQYRESDPDRLKTNHTWWGFSDRGSGKHKACPKDRLEPAP